VDYQGNEDALEWSHAELNCLWAYSKVDNNFRDLTDFLMKTNDSSNQKWVLDVYSQMVDDRSISQDAAFSVLKKFKERPGIDADVISKVSGLQTKLSMTAAV